MTCGLVVINLKVKAQYGKTIRVRIPATEKLTFQHCQEQETDTW